MRLFIKNMEEKIKISAIIKTKNNENKICETLESIKDFDEIIVIDEHSSDDTVEISKEYKAKIIYADKNNLPLALNQALDESKNEWIFILEENEILPQKLIHEIQNYIQNPKKNKFCAAFHQKTFYLNKEIKTARQKNILRLFKKGYGEFKNEYSLDIKTKNSKIHKIKPTSKAKNAYILKFDENDITKKINEIIELNKIEIKNEKRTKVSVIIRPIVEFINWYLIKGAIFEGRRGFIFSKEKYIKSFIYETMLLEKGAKNDLW